MTVAPISPAAGTLRAEILGAAETGLIAAVGLAQDLDAAPPPTSATALPDPVRQAVDSARTAAAGRQASLAPLFADLAQTLTAPGLPSPIKAAIGQVLALQLPATGPMTAKDIQTAVSRSGLFLEADLASLGPGDPTPADLKAALLTLQQALPASRAADAGPPARPTPPPTRDAALSPQAPTAAGLPARAELSTLLQHLRPEVEKALARLTLHQLASLPDGASSAWMFELPLATPQGAAVAQFQVERDAPDPGAAEAAAPWRARFSIDVEPLGPVHVHLSMSGGKAAVSLWAERDGSLERLRDQGGDLASALAAEVAFRPGAPGGVTPTSGHFLDQAS